MPDREQWKSRILSAGREAKRFAVAAAHQADALIKVARQKAETAARRRKMQRTLQQASRVLKTAGKAALAAGAVAAVGAVAREINGRSQKKRRVPA
jgi:isopentenyl diphosphate isomerase/L-lactate dehydrogenase-like FMN-dependent dehydrogenase